MKQTMHILVSGKVQGVGYRNFTQAKAEELGITGSVKNLSDSRVEIFATAEFGILESFIALLKIGPHRASVDEVKTHLITQQDSHDFKILRG